MDHRHVRNGAGNHLPTDSPSRQARLRRSTCGTVPCSYRRRWSGHRCTWGGCRCYVTASQPDYVRDVKVAHHIEVSSAHTALYHCRLTAEQIVIRPAGIVDVPLVLSLWDQARSEHATTPDRLEDLERLILQSPEALLLAEIGGLVSGVLIAAWDGWRGNLYRLVVSPKHRRCGVGLMLVRAGEDHLRRQGATRVTALVAYDDPAVASFWDAVGYPQDTAIGRRVRNI